MADGIIFYWLCWILWIIVTFIMKKSLRRTMLGCWILLLLLCSDINFTVENYSIPLTFLILLCGSILLHAKIPRLKYHLFVSFTITVGYIAILIWEKVTPVWIFLPRFIIIPLVSAALIVLLTKGFYNHLATGLLGVSFGELIYSFMLSGYGLNDPIGNESFFDHLLITILFILSFSLLQWIRDKLSTFFGSYKQPLRW